MANKRIFGPGGQIKPHRPHADETKRKMSETMKNKSRDALLRHAAKYLESLGWQPIVISADRIQGPVDLPLNYELVIRFTGGKPAALTGSKEPPPERRTNNKR